MRVPKGMPQDAVQAIDGARSHGYARVRMQRSPRVLKSSVTLVALALSLAFSRNVGARPGGKASQTAPVPTTEVNVVSDVAEVFLEIKRASSPGDVAMTLDPGKWDAVCAPTCDRPLLRTALFRVTGLGVNSSAEFNLPPDRDQVTLNVKAGSTTWYWTGILLSAFGGSFVLGGAGPPLLSGGSFSTTEQVLSIAGVAMLAVGLPLWILNRTTVSIR